MADGDDRSASLDSRGHMQEPGGGFIAEDAVIGKAVVLVLAAAAILFSRPQHLSDKVRAGALPGKIREG